MMGNDRKHTPDVAKSRPGAAQAIAEANLVPDHVARGEADDTETVSAGPGTGGSGQGQPKPEEPVDFCERAHELRFQARPAATPHVGQAIRLVFASVPHVVSATGEAIGELTDRRHSAIQRCLLDGYVMVGYLIELDLDRRHGRVRVAGHRG
jgi:hypothetical protein